VQERQQGRIPSTINPQLNPFTHFSRKISTIFFAREPKSKLVATLREDQGGMALAVALGIARGYGPPEANHAMNQGVDLGVARDHITYLIF
jgi:hypothetical protein